MELIQKTTKNLFQEDYSGDPHLSRPHNQLLSGRDTRRVDVVHAGTDSSGVLHTLSEDGQQLLIRARVLDGDDIGIHVDDGVDDVIEVGVAHVGVDLQNNNNR